jgi:putative ABC transport system permease protein
VSRVQTKTVGRQISLPWREAFRISLRSIFIRFGRAAITAAGVVLGIAFLMSVLTSGLASNAIGIEMDMEVKARQAWLVAMSLIVCGVGIMNSMFMSVTERFREIGTMKCLGALDSFVVRLFLIESGLMGIVGSLAGVVLGFVTMALATSVRRGFGWILHIHGTLLLEYIGFAIAVGTVVSIGAAIPPAIRAARMPPAAALRVEV